MNPRFDLDRDLDSRVLEPKGLSRAIKCFLKVLSY